MDQYYRHIGTCTSLLLAKSNIIKDNCINNIDFILTKICTTGFSGCPPSMMFCKNTLYKYGAKKFSML